MALHDSETPFNLPLRSRSALETGKWIYYANLREEAAPESDETVSVSHYEDGLWDGCDMTPRRWCAAWLQIEKLIVHEAWVINIMT